MALVHATCVAIGGRGVLLMGPPGAGKSDLALRLIDRGALLVADDAVTLGRDGDALRATCPATIGRRIEVRGVGIVEVAAAAGAPIALGVILDGTPERMPPDPLPNTLFEGVEVPQIALAPFEASAPLKVEQALALYGLPR
ncbi:HPr kinase/phosphorylase [Sphingomonas bacterium]|uniref:HPr kinase/phosphorylase n=1 Tax=Sphingomonas bacterium TaxID=1895847 RepID=UPI0015770BA7|nr:HPr kinase/phosphatase C-terminal domain-containing protein [Sphingomonas bacterium]